MSLPAVTLTPDPAGDFELHGDLETSVAEPRLTGLSGFLWYDRLRSRWVPASREAISPDGARYAYTTVGPDYPRTNLHPALHIVDIATGSDQIVSLPTLDSYLGWWVDRYGEGGIYLRRTAYEGTPPPGLWEFTLSTGRLEEVTEAPSSLPADERRWLTDVSPTDSQPLLSPYDGSEYEDRLVQETGNTGGQVVWLYEPGKAVFLIAVDAMDHPLVVVWSGLAPEHTDTYELWLVLAPGVRTPLYKGAELGGLLGGQSVKDRSGVWFVSGAGIFRYGLDRSFRQVSRLTVQLAGDCLSTSG